MHCQNDYLIGDIKSENMHVFKTKKNLFSVKSEKGHSQKATLAGKIMVQRKQNKVIQLSSNRETRRTYNIEHNRITIAGLTNKHFTLNCFVEIISLRCNIVQHMCTYHSLLDKYNTSNF